MPEHSQSLSENGSVGHLGRHGAGASSPAELRRHRESHGEMRAFRQVDVFSGRQNAALYGRQGCLPPHFQTGSNICFPGGSHPGREPCLPPPRRHCLAPHLREAAKSPPSEDAPHQFLERTCPQQRVWPATCPPPDEDPHPPDTRDPKKPCARRAALFLVRTNKCPPPLLSGHCSRSLPSITNA